MPNWLKITSLILIVVFIAIYFGFGWFASSKIMAVNPQKIEYDQTITAISGNSYTISGSVYDTDGIFGGYRNDGNFIGIFDRPTNIDNTNQLSIRKLDELKGAKLSVGDQISLQGNIWISDPEQALDLDFETIKYASPVGQMDAWLIKAPGNSSVWTIGVHGIGAPKAEMLRFINPVVESGSNMMILSYRNDVDNPKSPDSLNHLGGSEWADVEAAVRYARGNNASTINLYGVSLGGSIVENYLKRSDEVSASNINKVVLDSPALDWKEILTFRIKKDGYPGLAFYPASTVMRLRGVSVSGISTKPEDIRHKTLLFHNADDDTVPQDASKKLAEARPDMVTFVDFGSGKHTRAWNHDSERYEQLVTDFLKN